MEVDHSGRLAGSEGERIRSFALVISACASVFLSILFLVGASGGADVESIELDSRINPNDAPVSSLVRLPGIGMSKAAAIVAYRDSYTLSAPAPKPFSDCNDLQKVKGIGPKTAEAIAEWVVFE